MSKKSKLIIALATLFTISNAFSHDTIRLGLNLGNAHLISNPKSLGNLKMRKLVKDSYYVGAFVGYDHLIPETPVFVGIEGELSNHRAEKSKEITIVGDNYNTDSCATIKLSTNNSITGAMRLGVLVNQSLIYGKVGITQTKFKTKVVTVFNRDANAQKSYNKLGMVLGAGFEASLNKNFSFGLEHTFCDYSTIERIHPATNARLGATVHATKARLIYSF